MQKEIIERINKGENNFIIMKGNMSYYFITTKVGKANIVYYNTGWDKANLCEINDFTFLGAYVPDDDVFYVANSYFLNKAEGKLIKLSDLNVKLQTQLKFWFKDYYNDLKPVANEADIPKDIKEEAKRSFIYPEREEYRLDTYIPNVDKNVSLNILCGNYTLKEYFASEMEKVNNSLANFKYEAELKEKLIRSGEAISKKELKILEFLKKFPDANFVKIILPGLANSISAKIPVNELKHVIAFDREISHYKLSDLKKAEKALLEDNLTVKDISLIKYGRNVCEV